MSDMTQKFIAALIAFTLTSGAIASEAVVGRESNSAIRARVVDLVNDARSKSRSCGSQRFPAAPSLGVSRELNDAAADHARDMARKKFFDHRGSDGSQPKDRVLRAGYQSRLTGENIAYGPESAEEVVAGWLASPGHCANIMDSRFREIGVSLATGRKRGQIYWVQDFGAPTLFSAQHSAAEESNQANGNQIDRHNVVEQPRHDEDQDARK
jgi:uncharacterized protein YkwD